MPSKNEYEWTFASACAGAINSIYKDKVVAYPYKNGNQIGVKMRKIMNFNEYQSKTNDTDKYPNAAESIGENDFDVDNALLGMMYSLGMVGEAGEVADKIKKVYRDKKGQFSEEDKLAIAKELGDTLWYTARLAEYLGYTLEQIATLNIDKLSTRAQNNTIHGSGDNR